MPVEVRQLKDLTAMASITIHELREKLKDIKNDGVPISRLEPLSAHQDLLSTDYFTIARNIPDNPFTGQTHKDYNIKYSTLSAEFLKRFKSEDITATGTWAFGTTTTSRIYCPMDLKGDDDPRAWNKADPEANKYNHCVVTIKYYKQYLADLVDRLSSMYYNCRSVDPAFRYATNTGDIVTTAVENMTSMTFFGESWHKMEHFGTKGNNLMILGVGKCEANNYSRNGMLEPGSIPDNPRAGMIGGSYTTILGVKDFPNHTHKTRADVVSFDTVFRIRGTICPLVPDASSLVTLSQHKDNSDNIGYNAKNGMLTPLKMTGSASLTSKMWEGSVAVDPSICNTDGSIIPRVTAFSAHNNIPPVIFFFLQERIS